MRTLKVPSLFTRPVGPMVSVGFFTGKFPTEPLSVALKVVDRYPICCMLRMKLPDGTLVACHTPFMSVATDTCAEAETILIMTPASGSSVAASITIPPTVPSGLSLPTVTLESLHPSAKVRATDRNAIFRMRRSLSYYNVIQ